MHCVHRVKHLQGSTSNIHKYSRRPLSWLHLSGYAAPSTVNPVKSLSNSHAFGFIDSNTFKAVPTILRDIRCALYSSCINLALQHHQPSWGQTPSRQYQQYRQIFAAPSITVALILPHKAIYRQSSKIIIQ